MTLIAPVDLSGYALLEELESIPPIASWFMIKEGENSIESSGILYLKIDESEGSTRKCPFQMSNCYQMPECEDTPIECPCKSGVYEIFKASVLRD